MNDRQFESLTDSDAGDMMFRNYSYAIDELENITTLKVEEVS